MIRLLRGLWFDWRMRESRWFLQGTCMCGESVDRHHRGHRAVDSWEWSRERYIDRGVW